MVLVIGVQVLQDCSKWGQYNTYELIRCNLITVLFSVHIYVAVPLQKVTTIFLYLRRFWRWLQLDLLLLILYGFTWRLLMIRLQCDGIELTVHLGRGLQAQWFDTFLAHCDLVLHLTLFIYFFLEACDRESAHDVNSIVNMASKPKLRVSWLRQLLRRIHIRVLSERAQFIFDQSNILRARLSQHLNLLNQSAWLLV